ncbi:hypothetical protein [Glycomyces buryatensis]|uniref:CBU-0592-like domain-containing protein n=1 Tax=Glycomyces buryatensis TaxID=2570927 RepID=A0A4S8PQI7_9ACTN|nr:hypothetical protein [Glycomyces buryatensis]THV33410.1 hypothetical protein FAB82_25005 [Glycomyces buryatensis]
MEFSDFRLALQLIGAVLSIVQYLLVQTNRLKATEPVALLMLVGASGTLLGSAVMGLDWGLILLQTAWLVIIFGTLFVHWRAALAAAASAEAEPAAAVFEPLVAQSALAEFAEPEFAEPVYRDSVYAEAAHSEPVYVEPASSPPVYVEPHITGELELVGAAS